MALAPAELQSLATIGTAMELAGTAAPGSSAHMLGAACLLVSSQEAWNDDDPRVHSAAAGLLQVGVVVCNKIGCSAAAAAKTNTLFCAYYSAFSCSRAVAGGWGDVQRGRVQCRAAAARIGAAALQLQCIRLQQRCCR
jgi:hypothetical protein